MKQKLLTIKSLLVAVLLLLGWANSVWGAPTLTNKLQVSGYKAKAFYDFTTNTPAVLPTTENSGNGILTYRSGYGLHNYGSGTRSATATIPVESGDIIVVEGYVSSGTFAGGNIAINRGTKNATLTSTVNVSTYEVFDITATADDITFTNQRYYSIRAVLVMEEDLTVATPTFTIGSYNYEQGGYAVTPSCTTDGATLTYTIGGGAATACTSGVPFYAKDGKLNITASKTGWTSSSLASGDQWTLNVAPSTSSPETLIPFQASSDNGDKNIEHAYKSVTIAGGGSGAIAGISGSTALKLRTNQSSNTITLNVNSGYTVTRVSIEAKSNNKGDDATIDLTSTTVDGGSNIMTSNTTFPISTADAVTYDTDGTTINAKNNIVFTFDNNNITDETDKKNRQILATIKVWYKTPVENAIAECKTYETSSAFATAIDAESFASVGEVYAFHSAWQIAQAKASGSTDYSKAIMNRSFELHNTNGWTIYGDAATSAADDNDKYGVVEYGEGWSQYYTGWNGRNVSQTIASLPAGTYRLTAKVYSWSGGAPVRLFANDQLSDVEAGEDHDPVLVFTVAGNEPSIKIGIGGTGNENNTDNTWGTWGYRVKSFTLTKTAESKTISAAGWATYCSPYALDLENATGLTDAFIVTGGAAGVLAKTSVKGGTVPANTGLLLKGDAGTATIPVVASSSTDVSANKLEGVTSNTVLDLDSNDDGTADSYVYVLMGSPKLGFYKTTTTAFTVGANTAYLPSNFASDSAPSFFSFDFDGEATGVNDVRSKMAEVRGEVYNLNGQRVAQPQKGLYIVNGRKVVIK